MSGHEPQPGVSWRTSGRVNAVSEDPEVGDSGRTGDTVERYLETFERLRATKRWTAHASTFRFVALALGAVGPSVTYDRLESAAAVLRKSAGVTSPLRSEIRYVVAAMILRRELDPAVIHTRLMEARELFRLHRLPTRGTGPTLAALLLALLREGHPVPAVQVQRLSFIYDRWSKDHIWLTNAKDLPAAALHAGTETDVRSLTADVERAFNRLRELGFRPGNPLQLVSHLLAADRRGTDTAVGRFNGIAECLESEREHIRPVRYDDIATLALARGRPSRVVDRTLQYRDRLRAERPRPSREMAFSLAAGIVLTEDAEKAAMRSAGDLAALHSIQATLDAQQVAMAASISAGAIAAATSGYSG